MPLHRLLLPAVVMLLAACSDDQAPVAEPMSQETLYGDWAAEPEWCHAGQEGAPIRLAAGRFEGLENHCEMGLEASSTPNAWEATLHCHGEGMTSEEQLQLTLNTQETLTLRYLDRETSPITLYRCDS
ncbi:hypothetical protein PZ78_01155 [Vreelandella venusta]|nr:hypothetical protein CLM76_08125 [Halomonas hydrothermalis]KHJ52784.1 hypothetical protein PZ78_01155 [Halomonas hydrothermalis]